MQIVNLAISRFVFKNISVLKLKKYLCYSKLFHCQKPSKLDPSKPLSLKTTEEMADKVKEAATNLKEATSDAVNEAKKATDGAAKTIRDAIFPSSSAGSDVQSGDVVDWGFIGFSIFVGVVIGLGWYHFYSDSKKPSSKK